MSYIVELLKKPMQVGAVTGSSRALSKSLIDFSEIENEFVVEFGPGNGDITKHLLAKPISYLGIEINPKFYDRLRLQFGGSYFSNSDARKVSETLQGLGAGRPQRIINCLPLTRAHV